MTASDRKLHPLSILFAVAGQLKSFALPAILFIFFSKGATWQLWAMGFSVPLSLIGVYRYLTFRYRFDADEIVILTGLFFRNERRLRYERIQNIEVVRNPAHRLLRVADIRLQTGGGKEPEARLSVLGGGAVDEIRQLVFDARRGLAGAAPTAMAAPVAEGEEAPAVVTGDTTLVRLRTRDLIIFGLIENRGMIVIGAMLGLIWEADVLDLNIGPGWSVVRPLLNAVRDSSSTLTMVLRVIGVGALALMVLFAVVRVLSVAWAIVRLHGFTLVHDGNELRSSCGLLTVTRSTIPAHRIQLVTISESPLHRLFKRVSVRVQTAGGDAQASVSREWLAPILRRGDAEALIRDVLPGASVANTAWTPAHPDARRRIVREFMRVGALLAIPALLMGWWASLAVLLAFTLPSWRIGRGQAEGYGHHLGDEHVMFRSGWLWRHVSIAPYSKVQAVRMGESPFDRRWKMSSVAADTAGGGGNRVDIPYLGVERAATVYAHLTRRAAETAFRW